MNDKRYTLKDVVEELIDEDIKISEFDKKRDEYRDEKYKDYRNKFQDIGECLHIDSSDLENLKVNNEFQFTQIGKLFIKEILPRYSDKAMSFIRRKRNDDFIDESIISKMKESLEINQLYIRLIEGFNELFMEKGYSESESFDIIKVAYNKYNYPQRKIEEGILDTYIRITNVLEGHSQNPGEELTEIENLIWMEYMWNCIDNAIRQAVKVRDEMESISQKEGEEILKKEMKNEKKAKQILLDEEVKRIIDNKLYGDREIEDLYMAYVELTHRGIDISKMILYLMDNEETQAWEELSEPERNRVRKIIGDTDIRRGKETICKSKERENIVANLYNKARKKVNHLGMKPSSDVLPWRETVDYALLNQAVINLHAVATLDGLKKWEDLEIIDN